MDTASEALAVSIGERAKVDLPFMARLTGKAEDEIVADLQGALSSLTRWNRRGRRRMNICPATCALSCAWRRRQRKATRRFAVNVEALQAAQPKDLDASEIDVRLGTTWVDKAYIQRFMIELLGIPITNSGEST